MRGTRLCTLVIFILTIAGSALICRPTYAWNSDEHIVIGRWAYRSACEAVRFRYGTSNDARIRERLDLACTAIPMVASPYSDAYRETFSNESLFGEWCALAADHTQTPDQL